MEIRKFNLSQWKVIPTLRPTLTAPNESFSKASTDFTKSEIKESTWQGNIVCQRLEDETIDLWDCFDWRRKWNSAPTYTICGVNEIYQKLSRTRVRGGMMGLTADRLCRKCHQYPETVEHILSGCPELAQRQYLWRNNDALKWVLSELLIAYKSREKQLPLRQEPHSNYNNADVEILWDCTVSTDRRLEEEGNRPDLVVTDRREKVINVVEMACPSWSNRRETDTRKQEKYRTATVSESNRRTLLWMSWEDTIGE